MKISYLWLKEFLDFELTPLEAAGRLRGRGFDVVSISAVGGAPQGVVSARVESMEKHPNADKLKLLQVTDGKDRFSVVCGAPNVEVGRVYPFARLGAELPGGIKIEKRPIRGIESEGMMCSGRELGIGEDHSGLYNLPADVPLGQDVATLLSLDDSILDVEVTPNRPDVLSHWGVARELASSLGKPLRLPEARVPSAKGAKNLVEIREPAKCSRYIARTIDGVGVAPSPLWMRLRLERCGIRAISNLVDVTNYVLLELGHPLHVFDRDRLAEGRVIVRRAAAGESLECLDGQTRTLDGALVVADGVHAQAVAGVIGGQPSAVSLATRRVFLESAHFDPSDVRRTARRLHLATESSYRFERGTDPGMAELASRRAAMLILELAGGTATAVQDVSAPEKTAAPISINLDRVGALLGMPVTASETKKALTSLGFSVGGMGASWKVTRPIHRADIKETADVAEEIVRALGYDRVPARVRGATQALEDPSTAQRLAADARRRLEGWGFWEIKSSGLVAKADWQKWAGAADEPVEISNPLSATGECLNPGLALNLLTAARFNRRRGAEDIRMYEASRVFHRAPGAPREADHVAWIACGRAAERHWKYGQRPLEIWDAKAWAKALVKSWRLRGVRFTAGQNAFLHPTESQTVMVGDQSIGWLGRIHPRQAQEWDLPADTFLTELDLTAAAAGSFVPAAYSGLSRQPALLRDFSLVFPTAVAWSAVVLWIHENVPSVEAVELFDVFSGPGLPEGSRSLAFRVTFRDPERTLSDAEASALQERVLKGLAEAFQAHARAGAPPA